MKPAPVTASALTVTAAVPVEDKISDCVAGEFKVTSPNAIVVAFTPSVGPPAFNCKAKFSATPPALAVSVTF